MKKWLLILLMLGYSLQGLAQTVLADSLLQVIAQSKADTNRVIALWKLAHAINYSNPEKAQEYCQEAIYLSRRLKYQEGESRSLGILANTLLTIGNYPRALETNLAKLQIEEKRSNHKNMASVLMNIGAVYAYQEDYRPALEYYYKSDSLIRKYNIGSLEYYVALNLGDAYDKLNNNDSSFSYFLQSLHLAEELKDTGLIGSSMTGLAHVFRKKGNVERAGYFYRTAIQYLTQVQDDDVRCEASIGLATLYRQTGMIDSSGFFALDAYALAKKDGFLSRELDAAEFLAVHYKSVKELDSAFAFIDHVKVLNDSVNSKARIRELQVLSSNERFRQLELEESRKAAAKERKIQLQLLFIGMFIPGFFLLTLLLSRIKIHVKVIKVLGILSLLLLFEYLTLLLHPTVAELTHHTPVYEILIFVSIAAILIPAHHRIEHWLIEKLISRRSLYNEKNIILKTSKIKLPKRP